MILEYTLQEEDFLVFKLLRVSKSPRIQKKERRSWILLSVSTLLFAFYFYSSGNWVMTLYFGILSALITPFYPNYTKWRYKRHFRNFIKENYANRIGHPVKLEFHSDFIYSKDKVSEGKISLSEIEEVLEIQEHFLLQFSTGVSLLIPKRDLSDAKQVKVTFKELGLIVKEELDWKS